MAERYFTPEEVDRLVPVLLEIMPGLKRAHAEATEIRAALRDEQARIALAGGGVVDQAAWQARRQRLQTLAEAIQAGLERVVALGGVPKDLDLGLVDFPHRREGRAVNLCWRYPERAVAWWHGLDEGYAARRPL